MIEESKRIFFLRDDKTSDFEAQFHYVCTPTQELLVHWKAYLHPEELKRYNTMSAIRQKSFIMGRYCAKRSLLNTTHLEDYQSLLIANGIFGHPVLKSNGFLNTHLSLAHTKQAAVALSFSEEHPLGIDIEEISDRHIRAIQKYLSDQEKNNVLALEKSLLCTLLWAVKESISKVLKTGLMTPFHLFETEHMTQLSTTEFSCEFKFFKQYKCLAFIKDSVVIAISHPKQSVPIFKS